MSLNCLFIVQSEGRGHLTQALALRAMLRRAGHRVGGVLVGRSARREIPAFFRDKIDAPVAFFDSPNFVCDAADRAVRLQATLTHTLRHWPAYRRSLSLLDDHVQRLRPDVLVNFFEPLAGLYVGWRRPAVPMVCIAHQYLYLHPAYAFPANLPRLQGIQKSALKAFARLTSWGAARRLALAFAPMPEAPGLRVTVVPPLLRDELPTPEAVRHEPFLLVYLLNRGYAEDVRRWHARRPDVPLHVFWDHTDAPDVLPEDATLTFYRLHDEKFLDRMARCLGLVTTAGFESVCEAMALGKPALIIPVEGHFEQRCNALDAEAAGAGLASADFVLDRLLDFIPHYDNPAAPFRQWLDGAEAVFVREIEAASARKPAFDAEPVGA